MDMAQPIHFSATIVQVIRHAPDVVSLILESQKRLPRITPGQFLHLSLDEYDPSRHWPESRVFSVANSAADRKTIRLTISKQGKYTTRILDEASEGRVVACKGPYGEFVVGRAPTPKVALIAGGTGITPFGAYLESALESKALGMAECRLFYGVRTPDLLIYRKLADRCAATLPGFHATYLVEGTDGAEGCLDGLQIGRLDITTIADSLTPITGWTLYLSGPKAMIITFRDRLMSEFAVPQPQVLIDAWD
jgi:ferredoxin-NADP reductase